MFFWITRPNRVVARVYDIITVIGKWTRASSPRLPVAWHRELRGSGLDEEFTMLFRQKLAFFVFGCVFVVVGQLVTGLVVPSATAQGGLQDAEFNEVKVRKLTVVDATGAAVVDMMALPSGGYVGLYQTDGTAVATMIAHEGGAFVNLSQTDGTSAVLIHAGSKGGHVSVDQPDGKTAATMEAFPTGGRVSVMDKHGEPEALIGVDESGDGFVTP
jgi:hypothetical protein